MYVSIGMRGLVRAAALSAPLQMIPTFRNGSKGSGTPVGALRAAASKPVPTHTHPGDVCHDWDARACSRCGALSAPTDDPHLSEWEQGQRDPCRGAASGREQARAHPHTPGECIPSIGMRGLVRAPALSAPLQTIPTFRNGSKGSGTPVGALRAAASKPVPTHTPPENGIPSIGMRGLVRAAALSAPLQTIPTFRNESKGSGTPVGALRAAASKPVPTHTPPENGIPSIGMRGLVRAAALSAPLQTIPTFRNESKGSGTPVGALRAAAS